MPKQKEFSSLTGEYLRTEMEAEYRQANLAETAHHQKRALVLLGALYPLLSFVDWRILGGSTNFFLLLACRSLVSTACFTLAFQLDRNPAIALRSWPLNLVLGLLICSLLLIIPLRPETVDAHLAAVIGSTLILYLFIPHGVGWLAGLAVILGVGYLLLLGGAHLVPLGRLPILALVLTVFNTIGLTTARRLASMHRRQFGALLAEREANRQLREENEERRRLEDELRHLSQTDYLTGVHNRRWFLEMAQQELHHAKRGRGPLSLCLLDIDNFKAINDSLGHAVGDQALSQIAHVCRKELRAADLIGRVGGEEFAIAMPGTSPQQAKTIAERLQRRIAGTEFTGGSAPLKLTVTLGISEVLAEEEDLSPALLRADQALYQGKHQGRNCVVILSGSRTGAE